VTWAKIDDGFHTHPKILAAGNEAIGLHVRCMSYSANHLTDGVIPAAVARLYAGARHRRLIDTLLTTGLWHTRPDGDYEIHGWSDYNPSAAQVRNDRAELSAKRAAAGRQGGIRSAATRATKPSNREANSQAKTKQVASDLLEAKRSPGPTRPITAAVAAVRARGNQDSPTPAGDPSSDEQTRPDVDPATTVVDAVITQFDWADPRRPDRLRPHLLTGAQAGATVDQLVAAVRELRARNGAPGLLPHLIGDELDAGRGEADLPYPHWADGG
jgi:hypothetical protein